MLWMSECRLAGRYSMAPGAPDRRQPRAPPTAGYSAPRGHLTAGYSRHYGGTWSKLPPGELISVPLLFFGCSTDYTTTRGQIYKYIHYLHESSAILSKPRLWFIIWKSCMIYTFLYNYTFLYYLNRIVTQFDGLINTFHHLMETCRRKRFNLTPSSKDTNCIYSTIYRKLGKETESENIHLKRSDTILYILGKNGHDRASLVYSSLTQRVRA